MFFSIEKCRWCDQWKRREINMIEQNGKIVDNMKIIKLEEIKSPTITEVN